MGNDATVSIHDARDRGREDEGERLVGLVVAWSAAEPDRVGEVALLAAGESCELGRDHTGPGALGFVRQRPVGSQAMPPLAGPGISRRQLKLKGRDGAVAVENIGRCPMAIGGEETTRAVLVPGDLLTLKGQLVLLCVERTRAMARCHDFDPGLAGPFGGVDQLGLVGESSALWELRDQLAFAAKASAHVLVTGASGTGKELAATAIHNLSSRAKGRFLSRSAATLPAGLVDAELFGNARNYPNPGTPERTGLIGEAHGGTLFLDEIGELPTELQAHLLRVLDAGGEYHRLGESQARRADLRVIGATNRDPAELKHDLAPRLAFRVELPSLADRREDVPLLVRFLLERALARDPRAVERFRAPAGHFALEPDLVEALLTVPLPGNVRDLETLLWAAMSESRQGTLRLPRDHKAFRRSTMAAPSAASAPVASPPHHADLSANEVREVIARRQGNLMRAAADLGLSSRYGLYRLLKKLGIPLDEVRSSESR